MVKFVALQRFWALLPVATQIDLLRPYFEDSPQWSTLFEQVTVPKEE